MTKDCDNKDPPKPPSDPCDSSKKDKVETEDLSLHKKCDDDTKKPKFDPHEHSPKKTGAVCYSSEKDKPEKTDSRPCAPKKQTASVKLPQPICKPSQKAAKEVDPCAKYYPKGLDELFKKKPKPTTTSTSTTSTSTSKSTIPDSCKNLTSTEEKVKQQSAKQKPTDKSEKIISLTNRVKAPANLFKGIKKKLPVINLQGLKKIDNPKKMADKGSGAPARPMKYPYTFSAKFAQFPMGHYVKNQWIWKYYVFAFAACVPIFYSINKLANSPGNVAKWAEIRRKEAAEHHH